jgi:hypothetical protein
MNPAANLSVLHGFCVESGPAKRRRNAVRVLSQQIEASTQHLFAIGSPCHSRTVPCRDHVPIRIGKRNIWRHASVKIMARKLSKTPLPLLGRDSGGTDDPSAPT